MRFVHVKALAGIILTGFGVSLLGILACLQPWGGPAGPRGEGWLGAAGSPSPVVLLGVGFLYALPVFVLSTRWLSVIHWKGFTWVTDLLGVGDISLFDNPGLVRRLGVDYALDVRHLFGEDFMPRWPDAMDFARGVALLLHEGYRVALYCYGGVDRSPFIAALVLHLWLNQPLSEAYGAVLERRPQAFRHPEWERSFASQR